VLAIDAEGAKAVLVRKMPFLESFYAQNDHFAKKGSGHT
jgi:hypothetical protein